MDIIERKHAKSSGLATYYTGKLCRNGHLSYRYVTSGTCHDCISSAKRASPLLLDGSVHPNQQAAMQRLSEVQQAAAEAKKLAVDKHEQRRELVTKYFYCDNHRWKELRNMIVAVTRSRFLLLTEHDIIPDKCAVKAMSSMTTQYRVQMHADDFRPMCDYVDAMRRQDSAKYKQQLIDNRPRGALTKAELAQHYVLEGNSWRPADSTRARRVTYHDDLGQVVQLTDAWFRFDDMFELVSGSANFINPYYLDI